MRLLFCLVLVEYILFIISGVSFSYLAGNTFFSLEADPGTWLFYLAGIPQFITAHKWLAVSLDISIVTLLILFIRNPLNNRLALLIFILLLLFYVTLMGHLGHHNYQFGFCLVFIPFLFQKEINKSFAFEATRYFILFFYCSAAILKLTSGSLFEVGHFSHLVSGQFTPYFLENNTGLRTAINLYLTDHTGISQIIFIGSFILEMLTLIGFFTKRFDKWIAVCILLFHFTSWFIMDIAPLGQIAFISLLFLSKDLRLPAPEKCLSKFTV